MKDLINLCILRIICNCLFFSQWQQQLGSCRTSTSSQMSFCSNQLYNRNYCSYHSNYSQVYIIAENMEKVLTVWQSIQRWIDVGENPKTLPMRAEVANVYKIKYKTFCHCINGRTAAKGHASGGARRGRVFTVGEYMYLVYANVNMNDVEIDYLINICILSIICKWLFFCQWQQNSVLAGPPHL